MELCYDKNIKKKEVQSNGNKNGEKNKTGTVAIKVHDRRTIWQKHLK